MRSRAPSGPGPDGKTFNCFAACSTWLAGLLPAAVKKLGQGRWHPTQWDTPTAVMMIPGGARLSESTLRKRPRVNHTLGHIVPKPAKLYTQNGVPVHTADRARLVQAQQAFVRLLEDVGAPRAAEAYQRVTGLWQAAWLSERQAAINWIAGSHKQARAVAYGHRSSTTLDDIESAFSSLKRKGILALHRASQASIEYVKFRESLYAGDMRQDPSSAVPSVEMIMQGRSTNGPPMKDGFIQGSRFSCWHMLFAMEVVHRLWKRSLVVNDIANHLRVVANVAGIDQKSYPRRIPNQGEAEKVYPPDPDRTEEETGGTSDPGLGREQLQGSEDEVRTELDTIRSLQAVTTVLGTQPDPVLHNQRSRTRPRHDLGYVGGPVRPLPPNPDQEAYWDKPLTKSRYYRIG